MRSKAEAQWSRSHDAWIARECEGLEVMTCAQAMKKAGVESESAQTAYLRELGDDWACVDGQYEPIPHYLTDPAAAIRAAEAWQLKDVRKRSIEIRWCGELKIAELMDYGDDAAQLRTFGNGNTVAAALAQALYRATGGPV